MTTDTNPRTGLLIIGANQAGVQLAISLRALGFTETITLLGEENHRPYQRPALSKEFLQGKIDKERLIFRSNEYWEENNITLVKGVRIERIEKQTDGSGTAFGDDGHTYAFRRLALAVGARARYLDLPGSDLTGVTYLRNADDALELKELINDVQDAVVIGGGFIGLEAACSRRNWGRTSPSWSTDPASSAVLSVGKQPGTSWNNTAHAVWISAWMRGWRGLSAGIMSPAWNSTTEP